MDAPLQTRNIFVLAILFSAITDVILGGLVLSESPRRKINRVFGLLSLSLAIWGISFVGYNSSNRSDLVIVWTKLYTLAVLFVPPLFYHLILGSVGNLTKGYGPTLSNFYSRIKVLAYVFSAGWFVLMVGGVLPTKAENPGVFLTPVMNQQFWLATAFYLILATIAVILLIHQTMASKDATQKSRLLYMLFGSVAIVAGRVFSVILSSGFDVHIVGLTSAGYLASSVCLGLIGYSLTTSHLYHFPELVRKTLALLAMTVILLGAFGGAHLFSEKLLVPYIPHGHFFAMAVASITMALLFHPLRFRVQNMVDRLFFYQRYDQMQRLRGLSRRVLSSADRDELLNTLFSSLRGIGFSSTCLLLKDPQKSIFQIKKSSGLDDNAEGFFLRTDSLLIQHLREEKEELIREALTRRILPDWERQSITDEMDLLKAEICFPLFSTRRRALFGVLTLGNSELGYSSYKGRNIFWLKAVIDNAGIMLDNFYHQEFANALIPYVGRTWANEMRRNKEGFRERLAGHRTWVSVLMVDIRHFTPLSARLDPREVVGLLKEFRSCIAPVVYRYQGTIDKFIGDAVMIVFGLPILPHLPNPDANAVECGASILKEIEVMNMRRFQAGHKETVSVGIGISSGEVIAGNVDSGDRLEYTVIGDAANMVARLEDLAGDNQILISAATYARVKEGVTARALQPRFISGFNDAVTIYELLSTEATRGIAQEALPKEVDQLAANQ